MVFAVGHGTAGDKDNSDGVKFVAEMFEQSSRTEYDICPRECRHMTHRRAMLTSPETS